MREKKTVQKGNSLMEQKISEGLVEYQEAVDGMENRVESILRQDQPEMLWFLEHPSLLSAGTSAKSSDLLYPDRFPIFQAKRGGEYTYHGPGQRVVYAMLDLNVRGRDVRKYVWNLEQWIIQTLSDFNVTGERRSGRVGVWVVRPDRPPPTRWITRRRQNCSDWGAYPPLGHFSRHLYQR